MVVQLPESNTDESGHGLPPCAAAGSLTRLRFLVSGTYLALHLPHPDHGPILHMTGHGFDWQVAKPSRSSDSHASPPYIFSCAFMRWRIFLPSPHSALQCPYSDQGDMRQSTGHLCVLQNCSSRTAGHFLPLGGARVRSGASK